MSKRSERSERSTSESGTLARSATSSSSDDASRDSPLSSSGDEGEEEEAAAVTTLALPPSAPIAPPKRKNWGRASRGQPARYDNVAAEEPLLHEWLHLSPYLRPAQEEEADDEDEGALPPPARPEPARAVLRRAPATAGGRIPLLKKLDRAVKGGDQYWKELSRRQDIAPSHVVNDWAGGSGEPLHGWADDELARA